MQSPPWPDQTNGAGGGRTGGRNPFDEWLGAGGQLSNTAQVQQQPPQQPQQQQPQSQQLNSFSNNTNANDQEEQNKDNNKNDCFGDLVQLSFGKNIGAGSISTVGEIIKNTNKSQANIPPQANTASAANSNSNNSSNNNTIESNSKNSTLNVIVEDVSSDEDEIENDGDECNDSERDASFQVEEMFPTTNASLSEEIASSDKLADASGDDSATDPMTIENDVKRSADQDDNGAANAATTTFDPPIVMPSRPAVTSGSAFAVINPVAINDAEEDPFKDCSSSYNVPLDRPLSAIATPPAPSFNDVNGNLGITSNDATPAPSVRATLTVAPVVNTIADNNADDDPFKDCSPAPSSFKAVIPAADKVADADLLKDHGTNVPTSLAPAASAPVGNPAVGEDNAGKPAKDCIPSGATIMHPSSFPGGIPTPKYFPPTSGSGVAVNQATENNGYSATFKSSGGNEIGETKNTSAGNIASQNHAENQEIELNRGQQVDQKDDLLISFTDDTTVDKTKNTQNLTFSTPPPFIAARRTRSVDYLSTPNTTQTHSLGLPKVVRENQQSLSNSLVVPRINFGDDAPRRSHNTSNNDMSEVTVENHNNGHARRPSGNATITTADSTNLEDDWDTVATVNQPHDSALSPNSIVTRKVEENYGMENGSSDSDCSIHANSDDENEYESGDEEFQAAVDKRRKRTKERFLSPLGKNHYSKEAYSDRSGDKEDDDVAIHPGMVAYTGFDDEKKSKKSYIKIHKYGGKGTKLSKKRRLFIALFIILVIAVALSIYFLSSNGTGKGSINSENSSTNTANTNVNFVDETNEEDANRESSALLPTSSPVAVAFENNNDASNSASEESSFVNKEKEYDDDFLWVFRPSTPVPTTAKTTVLFFSQSESPSASESFILKPTLHSSSPTADILHSTASPTISSLSNESLSASPSSPTTATPTTFNPSTRIDFSHLANNITTNYSHSGVSLMTSVGENLVNGISKSYGILFDVQTGPGVSYLAINGMDLYVDTAFSVHYEVWTKEGSWKNPGGMDSHDISGFREVSHGIVDGTGVCHASHSEDCNFASIPMENFESVVIGGGGSRQSFYVSLTTDDLISQDYMRDNERHRFLGDVLYASSPELDVYYGASVLAYPLGLADPNTDFRDGKGFIGKLWYQTNNITVNEETESLASNTQLILTNIPSSQPTDASTSLAPTPSTSTADPTLVPTSAPTASAETDSCYYYSEDSCREAVKELGLQLGGAGFPFAGKYRRSGCHYYPCSNCLYGGIAYFGIVGTLSDMETFHSVHSEERLNCKTSVHDMSGDTPFWCVFPNVGVCSHILEPSFNSGMDSSSSGDNDDDFFIWH